MPNWINNPQADFVIAAYAVTFVILVGAGLLSWRDYQRHTKEWQKLKTNDKA